ncbi:MAG: hypothetical protein C6H99_00485 [Epsilonproteobacteria bacterium]|nr:hypothetical protein [Campylobacterota bacterium]
MICSNVRWLDIVRWKIGRLGKRVEHRSDLAVYYKEAIEEDCLIWLGHATFYLRLGGKEFLIDPVFGDIPFHKRLVPLPWKPKGVDAILISHGHFDHLDIPTLTLYDAPIIAPEGLSRYIKNKEIIELAWWQERKVGDITITALPAKHWHQRGLFDKNSAFWCSFLIDTIYFAGDSAYYTHFKQIGTCYDIDIALLPIGAYEPRYIMKENHLSPEEALRAFEDLGASSFIPYHYGTFILSDEPVDEPLRRIEALASKDERIEILNPGLAFIL